MHTTAMTASVLLFLAGMFIGLAAALAHPHPVWRWLLAAGALFASPLVFRLWIMAIAG